MRSFPLKYTQARRIVPKSGSLPSGETPGKAVLWGKRGVGVTVSPGPHLMSVHVMQGMSRLFVVIRFKATDVSLSEVGCAEHLKKNSCKKEKYDQRHGRQPALPRLNISTGAIAAHTVKFLKCWGIGAGEGLLIRSELELSQHQISRGERMTLGSSQGRPLKRAQVC